jgi:CheY-like chemotaxis protein
MKRILLVDDDGLVRRGAHRLLERAGYEVWETASAKVALDLLVRMPMDLVITDIYMPGMNGIALIRALGPRTEPPHLIAMTGGGYRSPADLLEEAAGAGADRTLVKPFLSEELLAMVAELLRPEQRAGAGKAVQMVAAQPFPTERFDPASADLAWH